MRKQIPVAVRETLQQSASLRIEQHGGSDREIHRGAFDARFRNFPGNAEFSCPAPSGNGALLAARRFRRAQRRAQFHHGLVPVAGRFSREQFLRLGFQARAIAPEREDRRAPRRCAPARAPRFRRGRRAALRTRCSTRPRPCSVRCPAAPAPVRNPRGNLPAMTRDNFLRGTLQVSRAAVIPEAGPAAQHGLGLRARQRLHRGKFFKESLVIRNHRGYARLLQHDFREPDAVRVLRAPPGKVPLSLCKPGEQSALK